MPVRWNFIIYADGRIAYKNTEVEATGDGEAIVEAVENRSGKSGG